MITLIIVGGILAWTTGGASWLHFCGTKSGRLLAKRNLLDVNRAYDERRALSNRAWNWTLWGYWGAGFFPLAIALTPLALVGGAAYGIGQLFGGVLDRAEEKAKVVETRKAQLGIEA